MFHETFLDFGSLISGSELELVLLFAVIGFVIFYLMYRKASIWN